MQQLGEEQEKHQEAAMLNYDCTTYRTILLLNYTTTTIYYEEEEGRGVGTCIRNDERKR